MDSSAGAASRTVAGRYRLLDRLGAGGMGTVWRAEDIVLGREVAIKEVTFPNGVSDEEREVLRERTRREARAAARLDHPSAVTVYDVVEEDDTPYLVMELVEARTLADVIRTDGPLTPRATAVVGLAVLGALEAAHAQGIVHRDVKPSNVLLRPDGRVVLTDFGIATFTGDSSITSTGLLLGSPSYIAPERARGEQPGPASDLWSLGATMFTAVEGRAPYDRGEALPTMTAVVTGEHSPFVAAGPLVPVLEGLLDKDPGSRLSPAMTRTALTEVSTSAAADATAASPLAPAEPAGTATSRRAERTAALNLGEVRAEVRGQEAAPVAPAALDRPAALAAPTRAPDAIPRPRPPVLPRRSKAPLIVTALALLLVAGVGLAFAVSRNGAGSRTSAGPTAGTASSLASAPAAKPLASSAAPSPSVSASASPAAASPSSAAPAASPGASTAPAPAGSSGAAPAPAGWQSHTGGIGWVAAVPASYATGSFGGSPQYKDSGTGRTLRVETGAGRSDPVQDRRNQAASFAASHPSYREISIHSVSYRGYPAADWEFTYSDGGTSLHTISRVFVVGSTGYSLYFQTRGSDNFAAARSDFDQIAASFRP